MTVAVYDLTTREFKRFADSATFAREELGEGAVPHEMVDLRLRRWSTADLSFGETDDPEKLRAIIWSAIDARAAEAFLTGFHPTHAAFSGEALQVRNVEDRTNWLTSQASYAAAIAGGFGDVVDATFRTAANVTVIVTYAEGHAVLLEMAAWGKAIMANSWTLKDAAAAGETIDIEAGWP